LVIVVIVATAVGASAHRWAGAILGALYGALLAAFLSTIGGTALGVALTVADGALLGSLLARESPSSDRAERPGMPSPEGHSREASAGLLQSQRFHEDAEKCLSAPVVSGRRVHYHVRQA